MPSGTGQTVQAPVPARFVVGFSDDVPAYLLRQVDFLDTGNGAGLELAIVAANAVVANAQNPSCLILVLDGTIDLDVAGAPASFTGIANGVQISGTTQPDWNSNTLGTIVRGRSGVNADQGMFACSGDGSGCRVANLLLIVREPTGATVGATTVLNWGTSARAFIENVTISLAGTLDTTEAGNLDLRTAIACSGVLTHVSVLGNGWKIRQFVAADFVLLRCSGSVCNDCNFSGGDNGCVNITNELRWQSTRVGNTYGHLVTDTSNSGIPSTFNACVFTGTAGAAVPVDCYRLDPSSTNTNGPQFVGCTFRGSAASSPMQAINLLSTSSRTIVGAVISGCIFYGSWDTMIVLAANVSGTVIGSNSYYNASGTVISDAGVDTKGCRPGMTWRGTFIAGAGATTAYAGMGEANAEMLAANAQKKFPAVPGVAWRLRVEVISNSMPAATVFTLMTGAAATALTISVNAAATGSFTDTDSVDYNDGATPSTTTWDLRVVETGVGTIVFSATLELI